MRLIYSDPYEHLYTRNSLGYRCEEFDSIDWNDSIAVFGCSEVFGVSVAEDRSLVHYLAQRFDRPAVNLGIPGGSNASISVLVDTVCALYRPVCAIVIWTSLYRYPYYSLRYNRWHEMTPVGVSQPEHGDQRAVYRGFVQDPGAVQGEFHAARRRVAPWTVCEYTIIGEPSQAHKLTTDIQEFGLDGAHSAGARCAAFADQIYHELSNSV